MGDLWHETGSVAESIAIGMNRAGCGAYGSQPLADSPTVVFHNVLLRRSP